MDFDISFKNANILVIGDVMLDKYFEGETSRISPEAPVPIVLMQNEMIKLGGAANVAANISSLGANVSLCGFVGFDKDADDIRVLMKESNIDDKLISCNMQTIVKLRIISRQQQLLRVDFEKPFKELEVLDLSFLNNFDLIIFSDYQKGFHLYCKEILEYAYNLNMKVLVDPKGLNFHKYKNAYLLTPNMFEFENLVGQCQDESVLILKARQLILELNLKYLIVTQSEKGASLISLNDYCHVDAKTLEVFDVTGAGDTVLATLSCSIASGFDLKSSLNLSMIAASIVVSKFGTSTVSSLELQQSLMKQDCKEHSLISLQNLLSYIENARTQGMKIVFTNGVFDILHLGHTKYLEDAKKCGDLLIVALNTDDSVKRLKGTTRPINTLNQRAQVLRSLKAVDFVISFSQDTPLDLILKIKPDVLVKGGDYTIDTIIGHQFVQSYGGEVKVLSLIPNVSTTNTIKKIFNKNRDQ